jgi:hypothetical protein
VLVGEQPALRIGREKGNVSMAKVDIPIKNVADVQGQFFRVTDSIPQEVWYWAALSSIIASAVLFLANKRDWSIFVGQWPPTFLLFGIFHKVLKPSR